ncbi:MAG: hypothetical protein QOJ19_3703 [Acidimicrobiia bacterium]|nr:hypothetical protein [Acidimicrobiia bacterium]
MSDTRTPPSARIILSKVPEITLWFWIIKVLCTTVGESFADWINMTLGVGLEWTSVLFTLVLAAVLLWQLRLPRYVPFAYWLTVVTLSVTGTLYTDILTDDIKVPLALTTTVFAAVLAIVFGVWYRRERTLSIHSINTLPRELFYWLAILVTFALGTAAGDWTLDLTGWSPGVSVLLPSVLIVAIIVGWRLGANVVLAFWLAYILTRPLGANLGDWLASNKADGGLGLGTAGTSIVFLLAILATVVYLTVTRADAPDKQRPAAPAVHRPERERTMLISFGAVAAVTAGVLAVAHAYNHNTASTSDETGSLNTSVAQLTPEVAILHFPAAEVAKLRSITQDTLTKLEAGDQPGATAQVKDLETTWDKDQPTLQPRDATAWHFLDGEIDDVLTALRAKKPNPATEQDSLQTLLRSLGG